MKNLTTIGIDSAKNFMQIHGTDEKGKVVLRKRVKRESFLVFMANLPKCLIGMEACGGSNYWAIELSKLGFTVKLMSPNKVKKYVGSHKNDAKDAEACATAVTRANMTFVPIKTKEQMDIQAIHRIRSYHIKQRTGLSNMMRGLLLELGIAISQGKAALTKKMRMLLEINNDQLDPIMKGVFEDLSDQLKRLNDEIEIYTARLEKLAQEDDYCKRMLTIPGIGPITATAMIAKIGNGSEFRKGRELSDVATLIRTNNLELFDRRKQWKKEKLKITQKSLNNHQQSWLLSQSSRYQRQPAA